MFQNQLPVPFNQIDQNTFNGNLPNGNDRVPNINLSQAMMQNQQIALQAIGYFRLVAQSVAQKTPLHAFCYNLLAQNGFQNQLWQQWNQTLVTFVEFLIAVKGYNTNDAIQQGAQKLYEGFMSMAFNEYQNHTFNGQSLGSQTPQHMYQSLQVGVQLYQQINNDCQRYQQGGAAAFQQQNTGFSGFQGNNNGFQNNNNGGGNLPRINVGGGGGNQSAVTGSFGQRNNQTVGMPLNNNASGGATVGGGLYDDPVVQQQKPLQPVEEISSDVYSQYPTESYPEMNFDQAAPQQQNTNFTQQGEQQQYAVNDPAMEDLKVPLSLDEIVMDPTYYQPAGYKLNMEGLYDHFYNPGGIEIRPAHKSQWTVTISDVNNYHLLNDPTNFIMFHVKFPDGIVLEHNVKWSPQMEYMRHELNDELRRRAHRPTGIVVESVHPISSLVGNIIKDEEISIIRKDDNLVYLPEAPIALSQVFTGSTELEVRAAVVEALEDLTGAPIGPDHPMPPVEYVSMATHYLKLTDEQFALIDDLSKCADLARVAIDLQEMVQDGFDPTYYRFLNSRLTKSTNRFMRENMSLSIEIDDFATEAAELLDYIQQKKGQRYLEIIRSGTKDILRKAISVEDTDGGRCVIDYNVNYQLPWHLDELASLNIHSGKPVLVSTAAHEGMQQVLRGMIKRLGVENIDSRNMRLITADGAVLELIRGYLVPGAMLLKLVK